MMPVQTLFRRALVREIVRTALWVLAIAWPAAVAAAECPPRPDDAALTEQQLLQLLQPIYSFQLENPVLPDPKIIDTAYDLARLRASILEGGDLNPAVRVYAVVNDRYARSKPDEILVSEGALLCLLDTDTSVLLTDGVTNHYAFVDSIDRAGGVVRIADAWARDSFLIGADLPEGMRGHLEKLPSGAVTIVVPLKTLASFSVGAIVTDNESFARRVAAVHNLDHDPDDLIALGLSVASERDPGSFARAIPYLERAVSAAESETAKRKARIDLAYVCLLGVLAQLDGGARADLDRLAAMLRDMLSKDEVAFEEMPAAQLTRIGQDYFKVSQRPNAGYGSLSEESENYLNLAIERDPNYADAFAARAETLFAEHKLQQALADAREAYRLNTLQIRRVIRTPGDDFVDQFYKFSPGISIVGELNSRRWNLLNLLAAIYGESGMQTDKLAVAKEATRLAPLDPTGWVLVAEAQYALGKVSDGRQAADHALDLTTKPDQRAAIAARLQKIPAASH